MWLCLTQHARWSRLLPKIHYTHLPVISRRRGSCQFATDLLRGNWCNGFWPYARRPGVQYYYQNIQNQQFIISTTVTFATDNEKMADFIEFAPIRPSPPGGNRDIAGESIS